MKITMLSIGPMIFDGRIQNEAISLMRDGHEVTIIFVDDQDYNSSIGDPDRAWNDYLLFTKGIKSIRVWLHSRQWKFLPRRIRLIFQATELFVKLTSQTIWHKADVYHVHDLTPGVFGLMGKFIRRARLVYDAHELEIEQGGERGRIQKSLKIAYERRLVHSSFARFTVNNDIAETMRHFYDREILVVENRPLLRAERPNEQDLKEIETQRRNTENLKVIMYVGYLSESRGVWETIAALKYLPENYKLFVLGSGRIEEFKSKTSKVTKAVGIGDDRVVFIPPVAPQKVVPVLSEADVSVMLLLPDGLNNSMPSPNKFYQSVTARVPMLASDYGRFPELLLDGEYGQLGDVVDPTDAEAVANKILEISSAENAERIVGNLERAANIYSWETEAKKLLRVYHDISQL